MMMLILQKVFLGQLLLLMEAESESGSPAILAHSREGVMNSQKVNIGKSVFRQVRIVVEPLGAE